jgi:hypothetical protein
VTRAVTIASTKILKQGTNGHGEWTMRKVFVDGYDDGDVVTFDDRIPDTGSVTVSVDEQPPYKGRRQFRIRATGGPNGAS